MKKTLLICVVVSCLVCLGLGLWVGFWLNSSSSFINASFPEFRAVQPP